MKKKVISILETAPLEEAVKLFIEWHIGTLPVVNQANHLTGLLKMHDLLTLVMPDFIALVEDFDFVHDFGAVEARHPSPETLARLVKAFMRPPISVKETCRLVRAAAVLNQQNLFDLPVIDAQGHLVGIASRVDIGVALMTSWNDEIAEDEQ
ncbi:MAG: CBS domain-containing protein [Anaerolineales bacterium]|nr:CBS domain-containing protein [Anaerolineales bacterium]